MKRVSAVLAFLLAWFALSACTEKKHEKFVIAVNPWIGYTPLLYIKESGWFDEYNIDVLHVISLSESVKLLESDMAQAIGGTQQEYLHLSRTMKTYPAILLDHSNGGDAIYASLDMAQIKGSTTPIHTYMETGTVNELLFDLFVKKYDLNSSMFIKNDLDQYSISKLRRDGLDHDAMLISYEPYLGQIARNGFREVANSTDHELLIVDMLLVRDKYYDKQRSQLEVINRLIGKALDDLHKDPRRYYQKIRRYLDNQSYEEFLESLKGICWIYSDSSMHIDELIKQNLPTGNLLNATK